MSEFKFACPVCGQHITADSGASGTPLECPTCFRKIVVPQAPTSLESKLILAASQVAGPRPTQSTPYSEEQASTRSRAFPVAGLLLVLLFAGGAAAFVFRGKIFKSHEASVVIEGEATNAESSLTSLSPYPIPTDFGWTLDVTNASYPEAPPAGNIHGHGFLCEHAILKGGTLSLRQGGGWPPDLGVDVALFAKQGEDLGGKTILVGSEVDPPLPKVSIRWRDPQLKPRGQSFSRGYALKIDFGRPAAGRMPGRIYISLPDGAKSFVAGTFDAEIRKAPPPKSGAPPPPPQHNKPTTPIGT